MDPAHDLTSAHPPEVQAWLNRCSFPPAGTAVRCGVSGGADSLALLVLASLAGLKVLAVHVDHQLRPGSETEAHLVKAVAERFGASFEAATVRVEQGSNLEERARNARRSILGAVALTGHTADDQAETLMINLMRGAGLKGLAAMATGSAGPPATKPLLGLRRRDTEAVCMHFGIEFWIDPSNSDPRFLRNRIRRELIPLMNQIADRDVTPLIARTAAAARDAEETLAQLLPTGDVADSRWLQTLPDLQCRLVLRDWLEAGTGRPVSTAATERALAVVRHEVTGAELGEGWALRRSGGRLALKRS